MSKQTSAFNVQALIGLNIEVLGGSVNISGVPTPIPTATVTLPANSTSFIFITSLGAISSNQTGFTGSIPLAIVTTGTNFIQSINDQRTDELIGGAGGGGSFSTITGGTNTNSLVVGSGGSIKPSGTGQVIGTGLNDGAIYPANFGVTMNALMCRDTNAQFTTSTSVTCLTANFTAADVGKAIFGTCCGLNGGLTHTTSTLLLPQGTITAVNSATNVTVSLAGTAATCAAGGAGCLLIWGTDDSAAWDATWTAATGTAGHCYPIQMGGGMTLISTAKFLTTTCNTGITGSGSQGSSIIGLGYKSSQFVILPNFVAAGCTGTSVSNGNIVCFGPSKGFQLINLGIWGGENGNSTQLNGKIFINFGVDAYAINVLFAGFASGAGSMVGVQTETSGQTFWTMIVDGFGGGAGSANNPSCNVAAGTYNIFVESFVGNTNSPLTIAASAVLTSYGGFYGASGTTSGVINNNGTFHSFGDQIFTTTGGGASLVVGANSVTTLSGDTITNTGNAANIGLFFNAVSAKVWSQNTSYTGGSANHDITIGTMGTFFDQGGNIFTTGVAASTILPTCAESAGNGTCVATAGSTNEKGTIRITAGTTTLLNPSFTMTFAGTFSGASAQAPACTFLVSNTGTGSWVTAAPVGGGLPAVTAITTASVTVGITVAVNTVSGSTYDVAYTCVAR